MARLGRALPVVAAAAVTLVGAGCIMGDSTESNPHGIARTAGGELLAVSCPADRGIEEVQLVPEGTDPDDWDQTVLELRLEDGAKAVADVSLDRADPGYQLQRDAALGDVLVTKFDTTRQNVLLTTWSTDLSDLEPGSVATRDGSISREAFDEACEGA